MSLHFGHLVQSAASSPCSSLARRRVNQSGIGEEPSCVESTQLSQVVQNLVSVELRFARDAVGEDVRNLDHLAVVRFGDHFKSYLESDWIEFHVLECFALDQKITAGDVPHARQR